MLTLDARVFLLQDEVTIVSLLIAYIGPETISPLLSIVAAIGGAAMMAGRSSFDLVQRFTRLFKRRKTVATSEVPDE